MAAFQLDVVDPEPCYLKVFITADTLTLAHLTTATLHLAETNLHHPRPPETCSDDSCYYLHLCTVSHILMRHKFVLFFIKSRWTKHVKAR